MSQRSLLRSLALTLVETTDSLIDTLQLGAREALFAVHEAIEEHGTPGWLQELQGVRELPDEEEDTISPDGLRALADRLEEEDEDDEDD